MVLIGTPHAAIYKEMQAMFRHLLAGALTLSAALTLGVPACAGSPAMAGDEERNVVRLKYAEADLQTVQGAKALALRLRIAAADVCGGESPLVRTGGQFARCREAAIDRAIAALDAPLLADALGRRISSSIEASR
jgi:UrcA family protein